MFVKVKTKLHFEMEKNKNIRFFLNDNDLKVVMSSKTITHVCVKLVGSLQTPESKIKLDRARTFCQPIKKKKGGDSCNQNLLLICLKGLVSHFETILTLRNTSGGPAAKPQRVCNAVFGFTGLCSAMWQLPLLQIYISRSPQIILITQTDLGTQTLSWPGKV